MSETHLITMGVIKSFLLNKDFFTLDYLKECIIKEGGIMRVTGNYTVKSYLEDLEDNGLIKLKYTEKDIIIVLNKRKEKINKLKDLIK